MNLCALSDVKALLDIDTSVTTYDAKLNLLIKQESAKIVAYLGYPVKRKEITEEKHAVNNRQILQLDTQPIQSVSAVSIDGSEITDYESIQNDKKIGLLYRGLGWCGDYYTTGMTNDIVSGVREILVSYISGWYLPDDTEYDEDEEDSLPIEISSAACNSVISRYRTNEKEMEGLKSYAEGDLSISRNIGLQTTESGLSQEIADSISGYKRWGIA